ncbi:MAG: xylulokinase [Phycisphaerales bacterium JB039]
MADCLLGIDIGTSSTKAALIDVRGAVVASATRPHTISMPRPGWSEQDPAQWWEATAGAVREALQRAPTARVLGIGLSGQMHGSVLLNQHAIDSDGRDAPALRPALLWNDQRTSAQCAQIEQAVGGRRALVELVGNAAIPGFTLPKILWLREHEPDIFARAAAIMLPKDYIRFRLTGEIATDVGDGAGTLLMDVDHRAWSERICAAVDLDPTLLPPIVESAQTVAPLSEWAAGELGLAPGVPVVGGSGDNMTGAVGAGVVRPGSALAILGTSGVIYAHAARPHRDLPAQDPVGRLHTMCAADGDGQHPGAWCVTGCMLSAAGSLAWAHDTLWAHESYETLFAEAAGAAPGCAGLAFLPYLTGERCPYPDPQARAGWIGLTARHTRADMVRAILEGVSFGMAQILELATDAGVAIDEVRTSGGGARSPEWRAILATALGRPVVPTDAQQEGGAFGAALLAGVGAGVWPSVAAACDATVRTLEPTEPDAAAAEAMGRARAVYDGLYLDLRDRFGQMAEV